MRARGSPDTFRPGSYSGFYSRLAHMGIAAASAAGSVPEFDLILDERRVSPGPRVPKPGEGLRWREKQKRRQAARNRRRRPHLIDRVKREGARLLADRARQRCGERPKWNNAAAFNKATLRYSLRPLTG